MRRGLTRRVEHQRITMKRPRKQLLLKLGVFLLLGVVVNVAVAWGLCSQPYSMSRITDASDDDDLEWWRSQAPTGFVSRPEVVVEFCRLGQQLIVMHESSIALLFQVGESVRRVRAGWPLFAVEGAEWVDYRKSIVRYTDLLSAPHELRWLTNRVPVGPVLPGFAINTIFYAAMLWLLFFTTGKIRRFMRIRRHRCPACGYQIASGGGIGPVCSECGAALPAAWRTIRVSHPPRLGTTCRAARSIGCDDFEPRLTCYKQ
jgi:hypothetical protein